MKGKRNHVKKVPQDSPLSATGPRPQKSRKGAKAWRKNTQISDVIEGLQKLREQRTHGEHVEQKANDQLFAVDVHGDKAALKRERLGKTLRSDEILALKSSMLPISGLAHKNSALGDGIVHKTRKGPLPASELLRLRRIAKRNSQVLNGASALASVPEPKPSGDIDLWRDAMHSGPLENDWVPSPKAKRAPVTLKHAPVLLTIDGSTVPSIELPEGGQSYNPPIAQWTNMIERKALEQERLDAVQNLRDARGHIAQGIDERIDFVPEVPSVLSGSESETENQSSTASKPLARATAKTQTQRNKELRRKRQIELEEASKKRKVERQALTSLGSTIETIADLSVDQKKDLVDVVRDAAKLRKHKFGKHQVPQDPLEIQLSDELAESLRTLKAEGNLFKDRFISLVKRGIVEARVPLKKRRRYALLTKEKYSHKFDQGRPFMA